MVQDSPTESWKQALADHNADIVKAMPNTSCESEIRFRGTNSFVGAVILRFRNRGSTDKNREYPVPVRMDILSYLDR